MECLASLLLLNYKLVHLQSQLIFSILCVADLMYMHQKRKKKKKYSTESCCLLLAFPLFTSPRRECKQSSALFSKVMRQGLNQENVGTERYVLLPGLGAVWAMGATCRVSTAPPADQEVISICSSTVSLSSAPLLPLQEEPCLYFQGQDLPTKGGTPLTHQQQQWPLPT